MTATGMPLILDNGLPMALEGVGDVDDLFGDASALPLRQPSRQIDLRMDKLRNRGCCRTVAWSKTGTIASITPDGQEIELRFLRCLPSSGDWDLAEPTICNLVRGSLEDPLVHLEWAETNNPELAVFDSAGRVAILIFSTTVNHPYLMKNWEADAVDGTHAVVGCHWLQANVSSVGDKSARQSFNVMFGPANKTDRGYTYDSSFVHAEGPSHPLAGRSALLTVTASGMLKMFWMQANNRPEETRLELESISGADEIITHAAFASEKKCLILALVTASRQLKYVRVEVRWGAQPGTTGQNTRFTATLTATHCAITSLMDNSVEEVSNPELTHVLTLPSTLDSSGKDTIPPMVLSTRVRALDNGTYPPNQSIIDRWEAVEQKHNVQSALEQLGNRRNSISSEPPTAVRLRPMESIIIDKCVVSMLSAQFGKVVVLVFADGSVQYRDRQTFNELYAEPDVSKISNLRQVGWSFPSDVQCEQIAFSPTQCSMVQVSSNGKLKWRKLACTDGDFGNSMKEEKYAATIAGLTVTAATSIKYQTNFDDILAVVRPFASKPKFVQDWVGELIRILMIPVDYVVDPSYDALLKNAQLPSCLGIVASLGFKGDSHPRTFQGAFAMLAASIRSTAFNMMLSINAPLNVGGRKSPLDDYEVVEMLVTMVHWSINLFAWISDSLFGLMNDDDFVQCLSPERASELSSYLEKKDSVALHLLVCSTSRCFLSTLSRRVAHLKGLSDKAVDFYRRQSANTDPNAHPPNPKMREAYNKLSRACTSGSLKAADFDKLIHAFGAGITHAYDTFLPKMIKSQTNPPQGKGEDEAVKSARGKLEAQMLMATAPPVPFHPVLRKFFQQDLPAFRKVTDPARLFFEKYSVLRVQDDHTEIKGVRSAQMDAFSRAKVKMGPTHQWRRCTRCTVIMEEVGQSRGPGLTFMATQMRRCPCNGTWAVMPAGQVDFS